MTTHYARYDAGTLYYKASEWPSSIDNDGSATDLDNLFSILDGVGDTVVLAAKTYSGTEIDATDGIDILGGSIIVRSAFSTDPDYETYGGNIILDGVGKTDIIFHIKSANVTMYGEIEIIGGDSSFGALGITGAALNAVALGLTINGAAIGSDNDAVYIADGGGDTEPDGTIIQDCNITANFLGANGVTVNNCDTLTTGIIIDSCTITNNVVQTPGTIVGNAFDIFNSNKITIKNNVIGEDDYRWFRGVYLNNSDICLAEKNNISYCWDGDTYPNNLGHGIELSGSSEKNILRQNNVFKCAKGIFLGSSSGSGGNKVYYNEVLDSTVNGIDHQDSTNVDPAEIFNNTVYHRPTGAAGHGIAVQADGRLADIRNNIVYGHTLEPRAHNIQCISITDTAEPDEYTVTLNNNCYHATGTCYVAKNEDGSYDTLAAWQSAIAGDSGILEKEANSIEGDPLFRDAPNNLFNLLPASPAINTATNPWSDGDGDIYDITTFTRVWDDTTDTVVAPGGIIDIGAYEFVQRGGMGGFGMDFKFK